MPLLDHFHPPLRGARHWQSFHSAWATAISADLNRQLPADYHAEPHVHFGIEIDVATMERPELSWEDPLGVSPRPDRAVVEAAIAWQPPPPTASVAFEPVVDILEVRVLNPTGESVLAAALELVSPANKDRADHREAFVAKCLGYLREGVGLIVVDVVTERLINLHDELMDRLGAPEGRTGSPLYAVAYHPLKREEKSTLDVWANALALGARLPVLPLWLKGGLSVPVDLEATYTVTRDGLRIPPSPLRAAR
jgi:hypothetical protein